MTIIGENLYIMYFPFLIICIDMDLSICEFDENNNTSYESFQDIIDEKKQNTALTFMQ